MRETTVNGTLSVEAIQDRPSWKRALDVAGSIAAMPLLLPLVLLMAVIIRFKAPGPIFFTQERIGRNGRPFTMFKFRTMKAGASTSVHQNHLKDLIKSNKPMTKLDSKNDDRLIPFGRILRSTGLDELPQVFNVLRGEMSLVGPRPSIRYEYEEFTREQQKRCDVAPGLTGLWQVSGKNRLTFDQMINLDVRYTREYNFWLDLKIIALTVPALVIQVLDTRRAARAAAAMETATVALPRQETTQRGAAIMARNARREIVRFRFPAESQVRDTLAREETV